MGVEQATKFWRDTLLPKAKRAQRKMRPPEEIASFSSNILSLPNALQSLGNSCGVSSKINAVDITRSRQFHLEFLLDSTGVRRKKQNAIAQTYRFANIVRDKDDRLTTCFPNFLNVAVKLLTGERVKRGERFVHQKHARIWCQRASQRNTLLHSAGKFVDICVFKSAQTNKFKIVFGHFTTVFICQAWLEFESEKNVSKDVQPWKQSRLLKHNKPLTTRPGDRFAIGDSHAPVQLRPTSDNIEVRRSATHPGVS